MARADATAWQAIGWRRVIALVTAVVAVALGTHAGSVALEQANSAPLAHASENGTFADA